MLKQFYEKALPKQGVYCVSGIEQATKKTTNRFAETLDDVIKLVEKFKSEKQNVYVALGSFDGYSRKADNCLYYRSFFIDLDVSEEKAAMGRGYVDKQAAMVALDEFLEATDLPPPVRIDSGTGIHAYWLLEDEIPIAEYLPYAEKFKQFCLARIHADPAVMADASRIMRCPETLNYKTTPPSPSAILSDEINQYDFAAFKEFLGEIEPTSEEVLAALPKGLDEETRKMLKMDNFAFTFAELADKSINGVGCNQIKFLLENQKTAPRDQWAAGLTIAVHCEDGPTAIHEMSNEHEEYDHDKTEATARSFNAPRTCEWFTANFPAHCEGCKHRGKIKTPIVLGREFKVSAQTKDQEESVWSPSDTKSVFELPEFLTPFVRGVNGGIYFVPPPTRDKKGNVHRDEPILISAQDLYATRRMYSPLDGECLMMRLLLPNDAPREFLVPMKWVYSQEQFKNVMASNGVFTSTNTIPHLTNYVVKWGQYMLNTYKADIMRMQMGWTESPEESQDRMPNSFVIGYKEIKSNGEEVESAASPYVRGVAKFLRPVGTFEKWQAAANELNRPEMELHAFTMLSGFGSPLMYKTSTSGVVISLLGRSGSAKTGALYAALSAFGNPKELSIFEATDNGMTGRYLGLHNIMLGVDEIGNKDPKVLSQLTHKISHGKAKIRMQASVNAEREHEMSASLIGVFTTNESVYGKFELIKSSPDGEAARLVEFLVKKPECLKGVNGGQLGKGIFDTFRYNYGHAGPMFIKEVFRLGHNYIMDKMGHWSERFNRDFGTGDSTYRFYENLVTANLTAGDILVNESGILTLDLDRIYHQIVLEMITIRDKVIKINRLDYQSVLTEFIQANMDKTLIIKDGKVTLEPRNSILARIESEKNLVQVSKTEFKKYLTQRQISVREFEFDMREKNILFDDKKGRLTTGWKSAISLDPAYLYWFKTPVAEDLLDKDEPLANTGT